MAVPGLAMRLIVLAVLCVASILAAIATEGFERIASSGAALVFLLLLARHADRLCQDETEDHH